MFNFEGVGNALMRSGMDESIPYLGGVAQLGEHLPCKQGVIGSIPFISSAEPAPAKSAAAETSLPQTTKYLGA